MPDKEKDASSSLLDFLEGRDFAELDNGGEEEEEEKEEEEEAKREPKDTSHGSLPYTFLEKKRFISTQESEEQYAKEKEEQEPEVKKKEESRLDFDNPDIGERLWQVSREELDNADFGIICVDDAGLIRFYNKWESRFADVESENAQGKNFFTQVAPCTRNRIFYGRFKEGVQADSIDESFTYTFTYKMSPVLVDIRMYRDSWQNNWILVRAR